MKVYRKGTKKMDSFCYARKGRKQPRYIHTEYYVFPRPIKNHWTERRNSRVSNGPVKIHNVTHAFASISANVLLVNMRDDLSEENVGTKDQLCHEDGVEMGAQDCAKNNS